MRAQGCGVGPFKYLSRVSLWGHKKKKAGKKFFSLSLFGLALGHSRLSDFFYIFESFYATNSKRKEKKNLGRRSGPKINPKRRQHPKLAKNASRGGLRGRLFGHMSVFCEFWDSGRAWLGPKMVSGKLPRHFKLFIDLRRGSKTSRPASERPHVTSQGPFWDNLCSDFQVSFEMQS